MSSSDTETSLLSIALPVLYGVALSTSSGEVTVGNVRWINVGILQLPTVFIVLLLILDILDVLSIRLKSTLKLKTLRQPFT